MNQHKYASLPQTAFKTAAKYPLSPSNSNQYLQLRSSPARSKMAVDRFHTARVEHKDDFENHKENRILNHIEYDLLVSQHRLEVEQLMVEISRLNVIIFENENCRKIEIQRLKDQFSNLAHLQLSNLRQSQFSQSEMLEIQLRKLKEQLMEKVQENQALEDKQVREKEYLEKENERVRMEMKSMIERKNNELYELQQENEWKRNELERSKESKVEEVKHQCDKQVHSIIKNLQDKERDFLKLKTKHEADQQEHKKHLISLDDSRQQLENKHEQQIQHQSQKYQRLRSELTTILEQTEDSSAGSIKLMNDIFSAEYSKLMRVIDLKEQENNKACIHYDARILSLKVDFECSEKQKQQLKTLLRDQMQQHLQEIELMKVKMASLHQADLQSLTELYQHQVKTLGKNLEDADSENNELRAALQRESQKVYDSKKRYEMVLSELNSKVLKLRMGLITMETNFKEKIENEKSLMLMTSRSFIKEVETKNKDAKFQEEELRKLRQLLEMERKENEQEEKIVEERIKIAQERLEMLTNSIVAIKKDHQEKVEEYELKIGQQNHEIQRLNGILRTFEVPLFDNSTELKQIEHLTQELKIKNEEMLILKDKITFLENRISQMKGDLERYQLEASINQEEAKKHYHAISDHNLQEHRNFYESQIESLQEDKADLKKLVGSQKEQITELVKRYKELEEQLEETIVVMRKRGELEGRVMELGMDNNLVKNLAEMVRRT